MAVISQVRVANMALNNLGTNTTIESFAENSLEADVADLWYDFSRLATLEAFDWGFARKRLTLAVHSEAAPSGVWLYRYQYPADAVRVRELVNPLGDQADAVPYKIETDATGTQKTIVTDLEDACVVYTFDNSQTSLFSPYFVISLSFKLAEMMALGITGKRTLREANREDFRLSLIDAMASGANETVEKPPRDAEHIRFRL